MCGLESKWTQLCWQIFAAYLFIHNITLGLECKFIFLVDLGPGDNSGAHLLMDHNVMEFSEKNDYYF